MKTTLLPTIFALAITLPGLIAQGGPANERLDALCRASLANQGVGMSVAVVRDGEVVLSRGYGKRSIRGDSTVGVDTKFAIGSITKQFTCACVLLLEEERKLSVGDPIARWFPDITRAADITLYDLMNHVSGIPDYYPLDFVDLRMREAIEPDALIRRYACGPLDFEPGTRWSYSNTGYVVLGRVVEKVSGMPFGRFLEQRILRPLGLEHTVYEPEGHDDGMAEGQTSFALGPPEPCTPEGRGWIGAAGAIWSTAGDLARWDLALMGGKVLSPAALIVMTAARTCKDGRETGYGCGLSIGLRDGRPTWSHNGAVDGFLATNTMVPSRGVAVVVLTNLGVGGGASDLAGALLGELLKEPVPAVPAVKGPSIADTVRAVFADLQTEPLDRSRFTADFDAWLDPDRARGARERLAPFGKPDRVDVLRVAERGGMEVSTTRLSFAKRSLRVLMYRHVDGRIAQFFVGAEDAR